MLRLHLSLAELDVHRGVVRNEVEVGAHRVELSPEVVNDTLGTLLKYQDDIVKIQGSEAARLLGEVRMELQA